MKEIKNAVCYRPLAELKKLPNNPRTIKREDLVRLKKSIENNRKLSNAWFFAKPTANKDHPTMKPIGLCVKGVLALSEQGDVVFDPFLGSGSTLIACEQTGRKCYGREIDPKYCDVIRKRYWKFTTGSEEGWQDGTKPLGGGDDGE